MDLKSLRKTLRQTRRNLTVSDQRQHALAATHYLLRSRWLQRPKRVAVFLAQDGELTTDLLIKHLWHRGHQVLLPIIQPKSGQLKFAQYLPNTPLVANQFGILEPDVAQHVALSAKAVDVVLMPLVGFDLNGNRLGMGGGFYDKTFAFKLGVKRRPHLVGWAHGCQQVASLPTQPWDVPMDALVTESGLVQFKTRSTRPGA